MREIKSLTGASQNIYFKQNTAVENRKTGEIVHFNKGDSLKFEKPLEKHKDFVMLYLENAPLLSFLGDSASSLLYAIIKTMNNNIWGDSKEFRSNIYGKRAIATNNVLMSNKSYKIALDALLKNGVLIDINTEEAQKACNINQKDIQFISGDLYLVNPNFIGTGRIEDIMELRQALEVRFYRDSDGYFNVEKNTEVSVAYKGFEEVAKHPENYEIKSLETKNNHRTTTIKEREPQDEVIDIVEVSQEPQALPAPQPQPKSDKEIELEILREQNKKYELETKLVREQNKKYELETKRAEMLLEYKRQNIEVNESLFNADGSPNEKIMKNDKDL